MRFATGPDTLAWTGLGAGYSQFAQAMRTGAMAGFWQDLRWPCGQDEVAPLSPDQGIAAYRFLFTVQSRPISRAGSCPVPFTELLILHADIE